jgi:hypothetical protein
VLWVNADTALAYSEKLGAFTSFYSYCNIPYFCNLEDTGIWINCDSKEEEDVDEGPHLVWEANLWKHQAGEYCNFFGTKKPYWMTLVGNPEPQMDKIFTNLEFRACVEGDGEQTNAGKFIPTLPFDSLEVWNEYQHGITGLANKSGHDLFKHHANGSSSLKRKFRIWRCDIPRDNASIDTVNESKMGIYRKTSTPHYNDRMRNPWLYLKLLKNIPVSGSVPKTEVHDVMMTYFE